MFFYFFGIFLSAFLIWEYVAIPLISALSFRLCFLISVFRCKKLRPGIKHFLSFTLHMVGETLLDWFKFTFSYIPSRVSGQGFEWSGMFRFSTWVDIS